MAEILLSPVCACGTPQRGYALTVVGPTWVTDSRHRLVPKRVPWLNANDTGHWTKHDANIAAWRAAGAEVFTAALTAGLPRLDLVHVTAYIRKPRTGIRWDPANLHPTVKAVVDGGTDAGVWPDDDVRHVVGPDLRAGVPIERPRRRRGEPPRLLPVGEVVLHLVPLGGAG